MKNGFCYMCSRLGTDSCSHCDGPKQRVFYAEDVFKFYHSRQEIEQALEDLGYQCQYVAHNPDEQIWYRKNSKILVLVNWIDMHVYYFAQAGEDWLR